MSILISQFIHCGPHSPPCPHMSSLRLHFYSSPSLFPKDGDGVGNTLQIAKPPWLWDVTSLRASVSHVGSVFLVFCWRTGHLRICESYLGKKYPKQTENGNFPRVTFSWPKGGNTGARRPLYLTQGPRALPLQSRGPQAAWGCHSVTRKSSVSSVLPWTLSTSTQERKEQFRFSEESGFNVAVHKQGDKLFFLLQGPFLIQRCPLSLWRPLPSNHHRHSPPQKGRLHIEGRLRQRWTKPSTSRDHWVYKTNGGSADSQAENLLKVVLKVFCDCIAPRVAPAQENSRTRPVMGLSPWHTMRKKRPVLAPATLSTLISLCN